MRKNCIAPVLLDQSKKNEDGESFGRSNFIKIESNIHPTLKHFGTSYSRHFNSFKTLFELFRSTFPFTKWIPNYSVKDQLYGDLYSGFILTCSNIPLGIACSNLAGVPGINGLYTILLASFIYPIFSDWSHGTMGPSAAIDISTGVHTHIILQDYYSSLPNGTSTEKVMASVNPTTVTSTLVFLNGLICLIFGMLRLDFITDYFSEPLVGGFSTGIALYVVVSQIRPILGIPKPSMKKLGYEFPNLISMTRKLNQTNFVALSISLGSILFLLGCKCVIQPFLNKSFKNRRFTVPWEFILLVIGIIISRYFQLQTRYNIFIIGEMPNELPKFEWPLFWLMPNIFWRSLSISIVQMCIHMFGVRVLSRRLDYKVDRTQEVYAVGSTLLFSSFFPVYSANNGLGQSTLLEYCGSTSQVASIFSGLIVLIVILTSASLFSILPTCVLAVIILIVVGKQLSGILQVPHLWRTSKWDFTIWAASFVASVIYGITYGLGIGMVFQLFTVVARTQWPKNIVWFSKKDSELDICIFEFESMLLFTNCEKFVEAVNETLENWKVKPEKPNRLFILDCTAMTAVDSVGFIYLLDVLQKLQTTACVYFVRPRGFLVKTLRYEGVPISDYNVCDSSEDAINHVELKLLTKHSGASLNKSIDVKY